MNVIKLSLDALEALIAIMQRRGIPTGSKQNMALGKKVEKCAFYAAF
jgi:hypothetical protein